MGLWKHFFRCILLKKQQRKYIVSLMKFRKSKNWEPFIDRILRTEKWEVFITGIEN